MPPSEKDLTAKGPSKDWAAIISSVTSPLGLLALVVLAVHALLSVLAFRAEPGQAMVYFIVLVVFLVVVILFVALRPGVFVSREQRRLEDLKEIIPPVVDEFDAFVSAPMAALPDDEAREKYREDVLKVCDALHEHVGLKRIYYAGKDITTEYEFEAEDVAMRKNLISIRDSKYFVLVYLEPALTSALVEAGIALALRKPSLYFVTKREDLPFLLRRAAQAAEGGAKDLPRVRVYPNEDIESVLHQIEVNKTSLFDNGEAAAVQSTSNPRPRGPAA